MGIRFVGGSLGGRFWRGGALSDGEMGQRTVSIDEAMRLTCCWQRGSWGRAVDGVVCQLWIDKDRRWEGRIISQARTTFPDCTRPQFPRVEFGKLHCCHHQHRQHHRHPVLSDSKDGSASIASHPTLNTAITTLLLIQCPRQSCSTRHNGKPCPVLVRRQTSPPNRTSI